MKRIAIALLVTAAGLAATSARADTKVRIGVNVGTPVYGPAPVVVAHPPVMAYAPPAVVVAPAPRGYWKEVQVRTWVPERWVVQHNRWGRPERYCEPGYFTYTTQRMWVETRDDHRHDYRHDSRHDSRDNRYGYNRNDHRDGWRR
jgi:hypothetical protein